MDIQKLETLPPPPGVIASLQAGFDVVSNHIALILLPVLLDMFLWLGPRVSVGKMFGSFSADLLQFAKTNGSSGISPQMLTQSLASMVEFFSRLNWLSWVRTFPIGIPALMLDLPQKMPVHTPLGLQSVIQMPSLLILLGSIALLTLVGWLGGGWYFRIVAGVSLGEEEAGIGLIRALIQTIFLSVIFLGGTVVIILPLFFVMGLLMVVNALLAQVAFFIILFFVFWLIVPLFFMPHGIFVRKQNAVLSIVSSLRMSRFTLPTSSMFVMSTFLLSRGLGYLWKAPAVDSWLTLVGIAGHAFISTTLLSASFVYYRNMNNWLQNVYERFQEMNIKSAIKKI